jgi:hypothetical protein
MQYPFVERENFVAAEHAIAPWRVCCQKVTIWQNENLCYVGLEAKCYKYDHQIYFAKIEVDPKKGEAIMKNVEGWLIDYSVDYTQKVVKKLLSKRWRDIYNEVNWSNPNVVITEEIRMLMPHGVTHVYDVKEYDEEERPSRMFEAELLSCGKNGQMEIIPMPNGDGTSFECEEYGTRCFLGEDGKYHVEPKTSFD